MHFIININFYLTKKTPYLKQTWFVAALGFTRSNATRHQWSIQNHRLITFYFRVIIIHHQRSVNHPKCILDPWPIKIITSQLEVHAVFVAWPIHRYKWRHMGKRGQEVTSSIYIDVSVSSSNVISHRLHSQAAADLNVTNLCSSNSHRSQTLTCKNGKKEDEKRNRK